MQYTIVEVGVTDDDLYARLTSQRVQQRVFLDGHPLRLKTRLKGLNG